MNTSPINLFYAYAKEDEDFRIQLEKHLSLLKRQGIISDWHFRKLTGGDEWREKIDNHINNSQIILLLISADFISSDYCYDVEMTRAMELHKSQKARVIPVILRPCDWHSSPFSKLQALPTDGKTITQWSNQDEAFLDIVQGIRRACEDLLGLKTADIQVPLISHNALPSSGHRTKNVYCIRCGVIAGAKSTCIGNYKNHDFRLYSGDVYCAHCGIKAGAKSTCIGTYTYHYFCSYSGDVYCARCGIKAGAKSTCIGTYTYHDFKGYSGDVYCARCGIKAGAKSTCIGTYTYHDFKGYG